MRTIYSIFVLSFIFTISQSCEHKIHTKNEVKPELAPNACTFELLMYDTINKTDSHGLKQGKWIIRKLPGNVVIEAGNYKDNLKEGCWVRHGLKGEFIDSIYYENDIPKK